MIITDSSIGMDSSRKYTSVSTDAYMRTRSMTTMSVSDFASQFGELSKSGKAISSKEPEKTDELSDNSESTLDYLKGKFSEISTAKIANASRQEEDLHTAIRFMCLNYLLMLLIGNGKGNVEDLFERAFNFNMGNTFQFTETEETLTFEHREAEYEETEFNAKGIVKTEDGRELDFDISLTMSRSFEQVFRESESCTSFQVALMDPLVINLDTPVAEVSDQKFYFDLDSDGILDEVSKLSANSGFLALDLNEDGEINDGSELFGTKSGDGFKDLSEYDKDKNGWIDEADEVFDKLKIFCINEDGTTSQYKLKDKGVGAIYLGNRETQFDVTNQENAVNARIRKTGVFLYETGSAGTMQHVDLKVELGA